MDSDCGGDGLVCAVRAQESICVSAADDPLVIGMTAPISGVNQALGTGMKLGIDLAFKEQNDAGGIRGRRIELLFRDDAYVPAAAEANARALVDVRESQAAPRCPTTAMSAVSGEAPISTTALERGPDAVLAFIGNVGTPTMVRTAPVAIETGTIFFGAFTGASTILRDDKASSCKQFIFNVRASYAQEARATMDYFKARNVPDFRHMMSFDQDDSFGQAGYDGLVAAYRLVFNNNPPLPAGTTPITRLRYTRNDNNSVPAQVAAAVSYLASPAVLGAGDTGVHHVGIMMTDTYGAASAFIKGLRDWQFANDAEQTSIQKATRLKLYFSNVSFVGPDALSENLVALGSVAMPGGGSLPYTDSVVVSQVVPNYQSDASDVVTAYNRLITAGGHKAGFTSLEGYISARIFIAGLDAHKGPFVPQTLAETLEKLPAVPLGFGASSGFSTMSHQYSNSVWGTIIQPSGSFKNLYFWTDGQAIQFFE
ncbi:MAG TPA: ABC transporter substrate-binding protein [Kofleriaceae bacterium]|nr:ABC transporter substrate-binding protein [Kofleriaceae bacterium]